MVAGLETPNKGNIIIDGVTVFGKKVNLPAEKRKIGLVFQDYALFPHLSVYENITFGLHGQRGKIKRQKAKELLETVNLEGFEKRFPHELSGGQQQRVALARALANEPALLLMDEPFSNLDTSLREKMRLEIHDIIKKTGTTAIFVTHDQGEALALSDKIAFLDTGKISQVGTPHELYWKPKDNLTASFMGKTSLVDTYFDDQGIDNIFGISVHDNAYKSCNGTLCIRPELVNISNEGSFQGVVEHTSFVGSHREVILKYVINNRTCSITAIAEPFMQIEKNATINFDIDSKGLIAWAKE